MNKVMVGGVVMFAVVVVGVLFAIARDHTINAQLEAEYQSKCKVIGDARDDAGDNGMKMRTVYQCTDGLIHIM